MFQSIPDFFGQTLNGPVLPDTLTPSDISIVDLATVCKYVNDIDIGIGIAIKLWIFNCSGIWNVRKGSS